MMTACCKETHFGTCLMLICGVGPCPSPSIRLSGAGDTAYIRRAYNFFWHICVMADSEYVAKDRRSESGSRMKARHDAFVWKSNEDQPQCARSIKGPIFYPSLYVCVSS